MQNSKLHLNLQECDTVNLKVPVFLWANGIFLPIGNVTYERLEILYTFAQV